MSTTGAVDFTETHAFTADWQDLELKDEDFQKLQKLVMSRPAGSPVIPGTGGLRKIRFAPASWGRGKRGAVRVCYAFYPAYERVYLFAAYSKNESGDLPAAQRKAYKNLLQGIENELAAKSKR